MIQALGQTDPPPPLPLPNPPTHQLKPLCIALSAARRSARVRRCRQAGHSDPRAAAATRQRARACMARAGRGPGRARHRLNVNSRRGASWRAGGRRRAALGAGWCEDERAAAAARADPFLRRLVMSEPWYCARALPE